MRRVLAVALVWAWGGSAAAQTTTTFTDRLVIASPPAKSSETACLWRDASTGMVAAGACPTGTVTSVGLTMPSIFSVSGSPITTSGTLAVSLANQNANLVFAGPTSGGAAAPTFRSLVKADLPSAVAYEDEANVFTASQTIGDTSYLSRATYASQTTGWRIGADGGADFRYLFVDEMHAKSFIADLEQALAGGQIISKSVAMVAATFTCPAANGTAELAVRDLPSMPNTAAFEANDWVVLRTFARSAGSLTVSECVGVVTGYADGADGVQYWTFTRGGSGCEGGMTASATVAPDSLALDFGNTAGGTITPGYYEVSAVDGYYAGNSPYAQAVTWTTCPVAANRSVRLRTGNLSGAYGYGSGSGLFGFAAGDAGAAHITIDPTNGVRFRHSTTTYGQWTGTTLTLGSTSTEHLAISTTAIEMKDGATVLGSLSGAAWVLGSTSTEHLSITSTAIEMKDGSTVLGSWSGGTLTLGQPLTANNTGQIVIDSDSIDMNWRNNSGSTSSVFSLRNSGGSGVAFVVGFDIKSSTIQGSADGDRNLIVTGTGSDWIVHTGISGSLKPYADGSVSLGVSGTAWSAIYASTYYVGTTAGVDCTSAAAVTVVKGIVTGCS